MNPPEAFNPAPAHKYFAAHCFNQVWSLIDLPQRTAEQNQQMELLALSSLWHWTQREDRTAQTLSVGYWQVSRVYALLHQGENAWRYANQALQYGAECSPFYVAYAHEAMARAAAVLGEVARVEQHLAEARRLLEQVNNLEERTLLEQDIATISCSNEKNSSY
jgi:hypothetical protein